MLKQLKKENNFGWIAALAFAAVAVIILINEKDANQTVKAYSEDGEWFI